MDEARERPERTTTARDRFATMRQGLADARTQFTQDQAEQERDRKKALYDLANDLTYPTDGEGNQMNIHHLIPFLSAHLEKCGYRKDESKATITQIPHPRRGHAQVADDAVIYVPVDATGRTPQVFIPTPEEQPEDPINDQWRTKTHITVDGDTIKGGPLNGSS